MSRVSSKNIEKVYIDWYFDSDVPLFSLARDLSMNNISEIQPRAFHRLHLLSELWVQNHSTHIQLINFYCNNSHMASHSSSCWYAQTSVMGIDDSGLPLISPTKKLPEAIH